MKKISATAAMVLVLAGAGMAEAALVEYSYTIPAATSTFTNTFSLNKFDTGLGTLTDIKLYTTATISGTIDVYAPTGGSFTNASNTVTVKTTIPTSATPITTNATLGPVSGIAAAGFNHFAAAPSSATTTTTIAAALFNQYVAPGQATFSASWDGLIGNSITGTNVFVSGTPTVGGSVKVAYSYNATPTPIPAAAWLLGSGLLGLAGMKRRKG
jgi:hypothetical protein